MPKKKAPLTKRQRSRIGQENVSAWLPWQYKARLRVLQSKRKGNIQELIAEARNDLFAKHHVAEIHDDD